MRSSKLSLLVVLACTLSAPSWADYLYVANMYSNSVTGFRINADGTLTAIGSAATGVNPAQVLVDPARRYAYVANFGSNTIGTYHIESTGLLTLTATTATGSGAGSMAFDPSGDALYAINFFDKSISAYDVLEDGRLSRSSTARTDTGPSAAAVHPSGKYVYVANVNSNTVTVYRSLTAFGRTLLVRIGSAKTGSAPRSIAVDPDGTYAYVVNIDSNDLWAYTIEATGLLTFQRTVATGKGPIYVTQAPNGGPIYVANLADNTISYLARMPDGSFTNLRTGPLQADQGPAGVSVGNFVYVANGGSSTVTTYRFLPQAFIVRVGSFPTAASGSFSLADTSCLQAPTISGVYADRPFLWPITQRMESVGIHYTASSPCGQVSCSLAISSDDPTATPADSSVSDAHHVTLRAERGDSGLERTYTVSISCGLGPQGGGSLSIAKTNVIVPGLPRRQ